MKTSTTIDFNSEYADLLHLHTPRPIKNDKEFWATQNLIDQLLDHEGDLTTDQQDFLMLLGTLIEQYETRTNVLPELRGLELIKTLVEKDNLDGNQLSQIFGVTWRAQMILDGKYPITVEHIEKLSKWFSLPYELFFEKPFSCNEHIKNSS